MATDKVKRIYRASTVIHEVTALRSGAEHVFHHEVTVRRNGDRWFVRKGNGGVTLCHSVDRAAKVAVTMLNKAHAESFSTLKAEPKP